MNDLISYAPDIEALRTELTDRGYVDDKTGEPVFPLTSRTPNQQRMPPKSMTLVRCINDDDETLLRSFTSLEILGTYDDVFADPVKYLTYSSAYPHDPYTVTDSDTGEEITITPPKKFGVFA